MPHDKLAELEHRYRELKQRLRGLGFAVAGSVAERYTICGKATCRCHADPPQRHGPYYQYSRKVAGKTVSRLVTAEQADQYRQWITNRRTLDEITAAIDELSHQAAEVLTRPPGKHDRP